MHRNAVCLRKPKLHLKRLIDHFLLEKEVQPTSSRCSFYRTIEEQATDKEAQTVYFGDSGEETGREQCIQLVGNCDKLSSLSRRNLFEPARF